ncbi:sodium-dependent transporter [Oceanisphaera arctica]|uniref:Transporter n=1 Tax=Oceanisphaera arctica TaxID=641510 RepID=A0A2P5TR42_9GAMM|nr:sodium-dependent transporter [Oceanisphaera arctica]PPL18284.1 sodium-dependent transporter [Oceanisphaera arctica]GHA12200.1 transporter [Oceanisphaera arctica]
MKREQWGSRTGFILAAVGSAVGLGNIWRFPYMAYENGGGAFFIPYLFAMLTAGIPFMILEFTLGHKYRSGAPKTLKALNARFEWLGWFQVMISAIIAFYYVVVIAWAISYAYFAFTQAWGEDSNAFFFGEFLGLGDDNAPSNLGGMQWHLLLPLCLAWSATYFATYRGVKGGIEKVNKVLMPLLFVMVLLLIGRIAFLPGALNGINWLLEPDFSKIWDLKVWSAAYGQIFFTLSVGFAIMLSYASYLPEKSDINNNAFMTVLMNCGFSMLAGIMIFGALGYMANAQGKELTEVVSSGVGLAFVTLPTAINLLPAPGVMGPLFFLALVFAGISSHISIAEAVTTGLMDKLGWSRPKTATVFCSTGLVVSLLFITQGGLLLLDLVDYFINNIALLGSCLLELLLVGWLCRLEDFRAHANRLSEFTIGGWWAICIRFVSIGILVVILFNNILGAFREGYGGYSDNDVTFIGWGMIALMLVVAITINASSKKETTA